MSRRRSMGMPAPAAAHRLLLAVARRSLLAAAGGGALGVCLAVAGCSTFRPKADTSHFYFLTVAPPSQQQAPPSPQAPAATPPGGGHGLAVGLAEIGFPHYLERPELATRVAPNELRFSASSLWAEPLADSFARVLAADLDAKLGARSVVRSPWYGSTHLDCVVSLDVEHFEPDVASGSAVLAVRWMVKDPRGIQLLGSGRTTLRRPLSGDAAAGPGTGEGAAVAALSGLIDDLSQQIAQAVREAAGSGQAGTAGQPPHRR